jgi:hypothetical protein
LRSGAYIARLAKFNGAKAQYETLRVGNSGPFEFYRIRLAEAMYNSKVIEIHAQLGEHGRFTANPTARLKELSLGEDLVDADGRGAWAGNVKLGICNAELEEPWVLRVVTPSVFDIVGFKIDEQQVPK